MGRRTFDNLQFKERRRTGVQAQLFALRRALAAKAQLVRNQQRQIHILGRELANACVRIATLEQRAADQDASLARAAASMQSYSFHGSVEQAAAFGREHIDPKPPSDGVFDERLHSSYDIDRALDRVRDRINASFGNASISFSGDFDDGPNSDASNEPNPLGAAAPRTSQKSRWRRLLKRVLPWPPSFPARSSDAPRPGSGQGTSK